MRTRIWLGTLAFLCALAVALPASAITVGGREYALFAKTSIKMEFGPVNITGNVGVNDTGGLLQVGNHNVIHGIATADTFILGAALIDHCEFNSSKGVDPGKVCGTQAPANVPITAWPPLPDFTPTPTNNDQVCPANGTLNLPPGDYGDLDAKDNSTCIFSAGTYNFTSVRLQNGSILDGNGAIVNVSGGIVTEPGVAIDSVTLRTKAGPATTEVLEIGVKSTVTNSLLYAPNGRMHLHFNGVYKNSEAVAASIIVEPIIVTTGGNCACASTVTQIGSTLLLAGGHKLNDPNNIYWLSSEALCVDSATCPGSLTCFQATVAPVPAPTDTEVTLNIPAGLLPGNYHVIIQATSGDFCKKPPISLP